LGAGRHPCRSDTGVAATAGDLRVPAADGRGARSRRAHRHRARRTRRHGGGDRRNARAGRDRAGVRLTTAEPVLLSGDHNGVRTLTRNRPKRRKAIWPPLWAALADALNAAGKDRDLRALVITGAGGAFCSGADISVPDDTHPAYKMRTL